MGEFIFRDIIAKRGLADKFFVASAGTSDEEAATPSIRLPAVSWKSTRSPVRGSVRANSRAATIRNTIIYSAWKAATWAQILRIAGGDPENKVFRLLDFSARPRTLPTRGIREIFLPPMRISWTARKVFSDICSAKEKREKQEAAGEKVKKAKVVAS